MLALKFTYEKILLLWININSDFRCQKIITIKF